MTDRIAAEARELASKIGQRAKSKRGRAAKQDYALARALRTYAREAKAAPVNEEAR